MTPLERMARAIMEAGFPAERMSIYEAEELARAALMAIREPSKGMAKAGWATGNPCAGCDPIDAWTAMIDHVLKEG